MTNVHARNILAPGYSPLSGAGTFTPSPFHRGEKLRLGEVGYCVTQDSIGEA